MVKEIRIDEYDYPLPDERIAKHPLAQRDACKLLVRQSNGEISEHIFSELPELLPEDAVLIYNNTRVINARLRFRKAGGAHIEIFCLEPVDPADYAVSFAQTGRCIWNCLVGNSKKWKEGALEMNLEVNGKPLTFKAERMANLGRSSNIEFSWDNPEVSFSEIIGAVGEIPIPPYLNRGTEASDSTDYQTVYSHIDGSVAAPTAGLHFTPEVLEAISRRGIERRELTLHVGAGTFQPVKSEEIGGVIHCFSYSAEMAEEYLKMGFYLGIGGVVTFKNAKKIKEVVQMAPMERILLETDSPYLAPVPYRGKRNSSLYLPYVVREIAEIKGISEEEVIEMTEKNAVRLFQTEE